MRLSFLVIILFAMQSAAVSEFYIDSLNINYDGKYVETVALFHPNQFNETNGLKNHHFIVWQNGKAASRAIFETYASDSAIYSALVAIGANPGNNLTADTWEKSSDETSKEPDKKVEGSRINISFFYGNDTLDVRDFLIDKNGKSFDFRFGGNFELISYWHSGCVVCLQSCPGGKIGNRSYTMRDLYKKVPKFEKKIPSTFKQGYEVTVRFTLIE